jgi:hypothetical protein
MSILQKIVGWMIALSALITAVFWLSAMAEEGQFGTPKGTEGSRIFKATEHPYYSGEFRFKGERTTLIGSMRDTSPWDHLDYAGKRLSPVKGTIEIDVNEMTNTGRVVAEFVENTDRFRIVFDRFSAKSPYQDGGVTTRVYEHGDSGNGDPLYPKTWLYLGGWGTATMWKNDQVLYQDHDAHFMVMERSRDPKTHEVRYPVKRVLPGGETDPAGMEIDLWVRSKEQNVKNFPPFETFVHLFWDEVTWR